MTLELVRKKKEEEADAHERAQVEADCLVWVFLMVVVTGVCFFFINIYIDLPRVEDVSHLSLNNNINRYYLTSFTTATTTPPPPPPLLIPNHYHHSSPFSPLTDLTDHHQSPITTTHHSISLHHIVFTVRRRLKPTCMLKR